jgi:NitT/TauT family transport system permease protein
MSEVTPPALTARTRRPSAATAPGAADARPPRGELAGWRMIGLQIAFVAGLLALWEVLATWVVDPFWISRPSKIGSRIWEWLQTGYLERNTLATLEAAVLGLVLGVVLGVAVGFFFGRSRVLGRVTAPVMTSFYSLPRVAIAPLFVLWFGIGMTSKVVLSATGVFFLMFYNTLSGVRNVDSDLVDVTRIMGARRRDIARKVILPSSLSWLLLGLKLSIPYSLIGAVVGEIIASNRGLGYVVQYSAGQFDSTGVFAALFTLMVISLVLDGIAKVMERRALRWKPQTH